MQYPKQYPSILNKLVPGPFKQYVKAVYRAFWSTPPAWKKFRGEFWPLRAVATQLFVEMEFDRQMAIIADAYRLDEEHADESLDRPFFAVTKNLESYFASAIDLQDLIRDVIRAVATEILRTDERTQEEDDSRNLITAAQINESRQKYTTAGCEGV